MRVSFRDRVCVCVFVHVCGMRMWLWATDKRCHTLRQLTNMSVCVYANVSAVWTYSQYRFFCFAFLRSGKHAGIIQKSYVHRNGFNWCGYVWTVMCWLQTWHRAKTLCTCNWDEYVETLKCEKPVHSLITFERSNIELKVFFYIFFTWFCTNMIKLVVSYFLDCTSNPLCIFYTTMSIEMLTTRFSY